MFLSEQLAECIEDDAIADAEVEMERREERGVCWMKRVLVCRNAVTRGFCETVVRDDADGTEMSSGRKHKAKDSIEEGLAHH